MIESTVREMARRLDDSESCDRVMIRFNHLRTALAAAVPGETEASG